MKPVVVGDCFYCTGEDSEQEWNRFHFMDQPLVDTTHVSHVWWALHPDSLTLLGERGLGTALWWFVCADPERWNR